MARACRQTLMFWKSAKDTLNDRMIELTEVVVEWFAVWPSERTYQINNLEGIVTWCAEGQRRTAAFTTTIQQSEVYLDAYWFWQLVSAVPFDMLLEHYCSWKPRADRCNIKSTEERSPYICLEITRSFLELLGKPWCMLWEWMNESLNGITIELAEWLTEGFLRRFGCVVLMVQGKVPCFGCLETDSSNQW